MRTALLPRQNPFLLTLLCVVLEKGELPDEPTRTQIYGCAVQDLLGLLPGSTGDMDHERSRKLLRMMAEVAYRRKHSPTGTAGRSVGR
jgi:hypothetical protein